MCGIAGIYSYLYPSPKVDRDELRLIRDAMVKRGPEAAGEWYSVDGRVGLAHRRLSIIDLSERGAQPMISRDQNLIVTFNGEIYNYQEIKRDLIAKGKIFQSNSDTEILLALYEEKGEQMVHDLRGMFAFALWDNARRKLFLARDPYGIKPLYYANDGWTFRFASQVKALLKSPKVSKSKDSAGQVGFLLTGSVPEPYTCYQEIKELPAGSFMFVDETGASDPKIYFSIAQEFLKASHTTLDLTDAQIQERIAEALRESIRYHFIADVPVGIFLSAGIDSGAIAGLSADAGFQSVKSMTLTFEEFQGSEQDESSQALEYSRIYKTEHAKVILTKNDFDTNVLNVLEAMDQPSIDGFNTYFISRAMAQTGVKVSLSGLGGDELFGGYSSFRELQKMVNVFSLPAKIPFLGCLFRYAYNLIVQPKLSREIKMAGLVQYAGDFPGAYFLKRGLFMPWELGDLIDSDLLRDGMRRLNAISYFKEAMRPDPQNAFARISTLESSLYMRNQLLRDTDWASMAHSLEVRTPFVDSFLLSKLAPLLTLLGRRNKNKNFKEFIARSPQKSLPDMAMKRPKTGFSLPMDKWIQNDQRVDSWKSIKTLSNEKCHWSRRWAYILYNHFFKNRY